MPDTETGSGISNRLVAMALAVSGFALWIGTPLQASEYILQYAISTIGLSEE